MLYLPNASPSHPFAPPLPLELVMSPDAVVLGPDCLGPGAGAAAAAGTPARPPAQAAKEAVLRTVVAGGCVLIPVFATGSSRLTRHGAVASSYRTVVRSREALNGSPSFVAVPNDQRWPLLLPHIAAGWHLACRCGYLC